MGCFRTTGFRSFGTGQAEKKMCVTVGECAGGGGTLRKFIPDGLCFLSKVGADGVCWEEALGDV